MNPDNEDSTMPAYKFLYEKHPISGDRPADALEWIGRDAPQSGWEVVPTYEAECLVAYLMSLNQSHPLKEVKKLPGAPTPAGSPPAAPAGSPPAASAGSQPPAPPPPKK